MAMKDLITEFGFGNQSKIVGEAEEMAEAQGNKLNCQPNKNGEL